MKPETSTENPQRPTDVASGAVLGCCPHCHKTENDSDPETMLKAVVATCYSATNSNVVQCNWCGLSGPIFGTIDEAIEAWNNLPRKQQKRRTENKNWLKRVKLKAGRNYETLDHTTD